MRYPRTWAHLSWIAFFEVLVDPLFFARWEQNACVRVFKFPIQVAHSFGVQKDIIMHCYYDSTFTQGLFMLQ